jgi:nitrogen fixation/metabolism regulation signal transduction histidine kinase
VPGQPYFAHAAGAEAADQTVTAHRDPFVERFFIDLDQGASRHQHRAFDDRPQLPNVARPAIRLETPHRCRRHAIHDLAELLRVLTQKEIDHDRKVRSPIGQSRDAETAPEGVAQQRIDTTAVDIAVQIVGRGRHYPHVSAPLQHGVERALKLQRQLVNGFEEQCSARRQIELAYEVLVRGRRPVE